ncbi:hypothetical protein ACOMHN_023547 [Nucella lapillus]
MAQHPTAVVIPILLTWIITNCYQPRTCHATNPVVRIGNTTIQGLRDQVGEEHFVHKFLGIRYAQAPKGLKRFKLPLPEKLPPVVDATRFGARCAQFPLQSRGMSEDCLFLNVYAPPALPGDRLPVLVWIHGGGFIVGSGEVFEGDVLVAEGGVIVVTFNYRLGVLGFLCTGDDSSAGNFGLWDQREALKWVHDYVFYFGGDPRKVTLGGVAAGAASTSLHSLSPASRDLFRHVIQMSGSAGSPWVRRSPSQAVEDVKVLGARLECGDNPTAPQTHLNLTTVSLVACIRRQRLHRLLKASTVLYPRKVALSLVDHSWGPVEDGVLVTTDLDSASPFTGPLMAGLVGNEGEALLSWIVPRVSRYILDVRDLVRQRGFYRDQLLPTLLKQAFPHHVPHPYPSRDPLPSRNAYCRHPYPQLLQSIECAYSRGGLGRDGGSSSSSLSSWSSSEGDLLDDEELKEVFGDQAFVMSCLRYLDQFCGSQACYLYFAGHQTTGPEVSGMKHNEDVTYLFGFNSTAAAILGFQGHVTDSDLLLARDFRQFIINFIKTGVLSHLKGHKMALWTQEVPRVLASSGNVSSKWRCATASACRPVVGNWNYWTVHILWLLLYVWGCCVV